MKKLLALILCVMMFVAVIPTSAFAAPAAVGAYPQIDNPLMSVATYATEIKNMIGNTKDSIQKAYGILVGDKVVYTSAKGMDDTIVALVDAISKDLVAKNFKIVHANGTITTFNKAYVDGIKDQVRLVIDHLVAAEMAKNAYQYTDSDGSIDPVKYAQVFASAVNNSLTNKQFQKGYEAVATYLALAQLTADVNTQLGKDYAAFTESVDMKFDANFQDKYPELWLTYVDTLTDMFNHYVIDDPWAEQPESGIGSPFIAAADHAAEQAGGAGEESADPAGKAPVLDGGEG